MPTVLIVDDESDIRFLVRRMLAGELTTWQVAGEAGTGVDAIDLWRERQPDVIVLDERMPGLSGLETARRILEENPDQIIVLFTAFRDEAIEAKAADVGIRACLSKSELHRLPNELQTQVAHTPDR